MGAGLSHAERRAWVSCSRGKATRPLLAGDLVLRPRGRSAQPRRLDSGRKLLLLKGPTRVAAINVAPINEAIAPRHIVSIALPFVSTYGDASLGLLGDATRRAIFELLARQPCSVGELAEQLPVSRPAVSQHLKVLKD